MNQEKPKPQKWPDIINDLDNVIKAAEQNLVLFKAQLKAAQEENQK